MKIYRDCKCNEDIIDTFTVSEKSCGVTVCLLARQFGITITERKLPVTRIQEEEWNFYGKFSSLK